MRSASTYVRIAGRATAASRFDRATGAAEDNAASATVARTLVWAKEGILKDGSCLSEEKT